MWGRAARRCGPPWKERKKPPTSGGVNGGRSTMIRIRDLKARRQLPTSEGFAKLSDHARMPGRFFYRLLAADGR